MEVTFSILEVLTYDLVRCFLLFINWFWTHLFPLQHRKDVTINTCVAFITKHPTRLTKLQRGPKPHDVSVKATLVSQKGLGRMISECMHCFYSTAGLNPHTVEKSGMRNSGWEQHICLADVLHHLWKRWKNRIYHIWTIWQLRAERETEVAVPLFLLLPATCTFHNFPLNRD